MPRTMSTDLERIQAGVTARTRRRALVAGCIGNFVEWYDFALYGAFAAVIARTFFPLRDAVGGLLATYMIFVVAFLARPAGALLFGHIGDRVGRRQALAGGILLMALVTAATGALPSYGAIGWAAPALLTLLRIGQGVALGGEYGGSAAFVVEYAPMDRRGLYGGWQWATVALGFGAGIGAAALLHQVLPARDLYDWGWRVPFLLALPLGLIGLYIRTRLEDTPDFRATQHADVVARAPLVEVLRTQRREVVVGFGLVAAVTVTFNFLFVFLPNHVVASSGGQAPSVFAAALAGLGLAAAAAPLFGALSDRIGRRPVILWCEIALVALIVPASSVIQGGDTLGTMLAYMALGLVLGALALTAFLAELFVTRIRYSGLSLTYGVASAVFGGTAPFIATVLVGRSGSVLAPAWYATAMSLAAIMCVHVAAETAKRPLATDGQRVEDAAT